MSAAPAVTDDPTGVPIPKNATYISHREVQEWSAEISSLEATLSDPGARLEDRGEVTQQLKRAKHALDTESPPDVTPAQRDAIAKEAVELREKIRGQMCSQEEMRKAPPGAIGKHFKEREMIPLHLRWKNLMRILHKGDPNPDVANIEMLRPKESTINMDNAVIPGKQFFLSPDTQQYKDNYDQTFGGGEADPSEVAALREQLARLEKLVAEKAAAPAVAPAKPKRPRVMADAPCGKTCGSKAGALAHARSCQKCKAIAAAPEEEAA